MIKRKVIILSVLVVVASIVASLIAWAPWIKEKHVHDKVMEHLGGLDTMFNYPGETMPLSDVPKTFRKVPFVSLMYFPGEAVFMVTFYGSII